MHSPSLKTPGGASSNPPTPHLGPLPTSGSTTALAATAAPTSISAFMLDSRAPPGQSYQEQEALAERNTEEEARRLMAETKLWRIANSAMWVAWGIVQAHVPGLPDDGTTANTATEEEQEQTPAAAALDGATHDIRVEAQAEAAQTQAHGQDQDPHAVSTTADQKQDPKATSATTTTTAAATAPLDQQVDDLFKAQDDEEFDYLAYAQDRAMFVWGDLVQMGLVKTEELPEELRARMKVVEY